MNDDSTLSCVTSPDHTSAFGLVSSVTTALEGPGRCAPRYPLSSPRPLSPCPHTLRPPPKLLFENLLDVSRSSSRQPPSWQQTTAMHCRSLSPHSTSSPVGLGSHSRFPGPREVVLRPRPRAPWPRSIVPSSSKRHLPRPSGQQLSSKLRPCFAPRVGDGATQLGQSARWGPSRSGWLRGL